jgi:hypothetical protein
MVSCGLKRDVQRLCAVVQHSWAVCVSCKILSLERAGQDVSSCVEICAGANGHRIHNDIGDQYIDIKCKDPHKIVTHFLSYLIKLLKPSGYVMHHEVYHKFYALPTVYLYVFMNLRTNSDYYPIQK